MRDTRAYEVVESGSVSATDHDSVYVGFDVSSDQRTEIASLIAEYVDLDSIPERTTLGRAWLCANHDIAVEIDETVKDFGWNDES
jgi:hypothetical protein